MRQSAPEELTELHGPEVESEAAEGRWQTEGELQEQKHGENHAVSSCSRARCDQGCRSGSTSRASSAEEAEKTQRKQPEAEEQAARMELEEQSDMRREQSRTGGGSAKTCLLSKNECKRLIECVGSRRMQQLSPTRLKLRTKLHEKLV